MTRELERFINNGGSSNRSNGKRKQGSFCSRFIWVEQRYLGNYMCLRIDLNKVSRIICLNYSIFRRILCLQTNNLTRKQLRNRAASE